jgi:hypothetical protein
MITPDCCTVNSITENEHLKIFILFFHKGVGAKKKEGKALFESRFY